MLMSELALLIDAVERARVQYLEAVAGLNHHQSVFKKELAQWSILQVTEHLVHAEDAGVNGIWRALDGYRRGEPIWQGELVHGGKSIEEVVEQTWQTKEKAPEVAEPRWGGVIGYWAASLKSRRVVLEDLSAALDGVSLEAVVYPHPISGPLDARQRLEFLRFHLDRHRGQVERLKNKNGAPESAGAP